MSLEISEKNLERLDSQTLVTLLRLAPSPETVQSLLPSLTRLPAVMPELIRAAVDCLISGASPALREELQNFANEKNAFALWLLAELAQQEGDIGGAQKLWKTIIEAGGFGQLHEASLALARLKNQAGDGDGALTLLRTALQTGFAEQSFLQKADRLYARVFPKLKSSPKRPLKIAVLSSATTTFLAASLRMAAVRDGFMPEIYESAYGTFRQEILDANSGLYAFAPDVVVIGTYWRDANLPAFSDADAKIDGIIDELKNLWVTLLVRNPCTILQHNFDIPWDDPAGHLGLAEMTSRASRLRQLNAQLVEAAPRGVIIVDIDSLAGEVGKTRWASARHQHMSKQHPSPECLPMLADSYMALIRAARGLSKKVLVLDLDNTLWHGVIGEDGLDGIRVGAPSPEGEAHAAFQRYALELKERGVLLAVCSKNNDADARLPFEKHDGMVLKLDDFVAFYANWENKPTNLRRIAKQLNLGVDSFVFFDDNPAERALMRSELPEVAVPEINSAEPENYISTLHRGRWFESLALSAEDRARHASYKSNILREELQSSAVNLDDFLRQLSMKVTHGAFGDGVFDRVTQLIGKTNQFNLTTRRHSLEQVRKFAVDPNVWTQWFRLEDKFGDNGLIGLMIAVPVPDSSATWEIDTFLMSCRVIGRGMENYMTATLLDAAKQRGIRRVVGRYLPTPKNAMVSGLYEKLKFTAEPPEQGDTFVFDLAVTPVVFPDYFQSTVIS